MRGRASIVVSVAVCILGVATPALAAMPSNLCKNGSFEKPVVAPGTYQLFATGSTFQKWSVVSAPGNVAVVSGTFTQNGFSFPAKKKKQWLDLTGSSNTATGVAQSIPTVPGGAYVVRFWVGNVVDPLGPFGTTSTVEVYVDGTLLTTATNSDGAGMSMQVWKEFAAPAFTAAGPSTTIEFRNADPAGDTHNGLDAVKISRVL